MLFLVKPNFFNFGKSTFVSSSIDSILFLCNDNSSKFLEFNFDNPSKYINLLSSSERDFNSGYCWASDKNCKFVKDRLFKDRD